jgi:hypothetical protein
LHGVFRFALQALLDRRRLTCEAARLGLAAAEQTLRQSNHACDGLERRLRATAFGRGEPQAVALMLERQQRAVVAAAGRRDCARRDLAAASSSFCVMESLRSRALAAYRQAQRRREEAEIEESNAVRRSTAAFGN